MHEHVLSSLRSVAGKKHRVKVFHSANPKIYHSAGSSDLRAGIQPHAEQRIIRPQPGQDTTGQTFQVPSQSLGP